jgi:phosphatidylglycerol:prolipoprotein diacylglycerol transferase
MYRTLFHLPLLHVPIYGYGLMMVVAFLGCQWLSGRLATARGINPEIFVNGTLIALVAGVAGSRLSHILENLHDYTRPDLHWWQNAWNMLNISNGGLTLYGGLILAAPVVLFYFVSKHVPWRTAMDIAAPCIALGIAVGRIGCFLNGCCYGADTNLPWGVRFPYGSNAYIDQFTGSTGEHLRSPPPPALLTYTESGQRLVAPDVAKADPELAPIAAATRADPVHPTQLYSTFNSLLIMALVLTYIAGPHAPGRGLALLLLLEGPTRFILELLRVEPPVLGPMSLSMVLGLALFAVGVVLWFALGPPRTAPVPSTAQLA